MRLTKLLKVTLGVVLCWSCGKDEPILPHVPVPTPDSTEVEWLTGRAVPVTSIDPDNTNWNDLEALRGVVGDARVVLLGEPSHGDGAAFLAKARLIRFLHQEMGFDVLVFEAGLYPVAKAWEGVLEGGDIVIELRNAIFPIWWGSAEVRPVFRFIEETLATQRPLQLAGMDSQLWGSATQDNLVNDLDAVLQQGKAAIVDSPDWPRFRAMLAHAVSDSWWETKPGAQDTAFFNEHYREVEAVMREGLPAVSADLSSFWAQVLRSTRTQLDINLAIDPSVEYTHPLAVLRDRQMGENLVWLTRHRFSDKKLIVWAANYHIIRNIETLELLEEPGFYSDLSTMGDVVRAELGHEAFVMGFTAYRGSWGLWYPSAPRHALPAPEPGALEWLLGATALEYAVLDFRDLPPDGQWLREPRVGWPLGYEDIRGSWPEVMDAIFYIRDMTASTEAP